MPNYENYINESEADFLTDTYKANAQDPDFKAAPMADVGKEPGQTLHLYGIDRRLEGQSGWSVTTSCTEPELVCQYMVQRRTAGGKLGHRGRNL